MGSKKGEEEVKSKLAIAAVPVILMFLGRISHVAIGTHVALGVVIAWISISG